MDPGGGQRSRLKNDDCEFLILDHISFISLGNGWEVVTPVMTKQASWHMALFLVYLKFICVYNNHVELPMTPNQSDIGAFSFSLLLKQAARLLE